MTPLKDKTHKIAKLPKTEDTQQALVLNQEQAYTQLKRDHYHNLALPHSFYISSTIIRKFIHQHEKLEKSHKNA